MNQLAVAISIVLFPGLIASVICDKVIVHYQRWDAFKYGIYSFLFGLISYAALQGVASAFGAIGLALPGIRAAESGLSVWTLILEEKYKINLLEVLWATSVAPIVAAVAAATINWKLINRFAKWAGFSQKYGDENLYSFFLNAEGVEWVYVRDKSGGLTYVGKVFSFAEYSGTHELVLADVEVFDYETSDRLYRVASVYLAKPVGNFVIEMAIPEELESSNGKETVPRVVDKGHDQET